MKRERYSNSDEAISTADATAQYGIYNPGYSFIRPPVAQTKPSNKRLLGEDSNAAIDNSSSKSEPKPKKFKELSIKKEAEEEDLYGLEPGIGLSRRRSSNLRDVQTPRHNISNSPDVQTQALIQHPRENSRPSIAGNGPSEDENPIMSTIKEKLHKAILDLTSDEPPPSEDLPPWGNHFALSGSSSKLINPAITIYGLGGIGLPLSERDAELIAKFNCPAPDSDTKMSNAMVDLTTSKITELTPHQLEMTDPGWEKAVEAVVAKVAKKLKVPGGPANVGFLPCNMTLYRPGDMLKGYQESKKQTGMFGTLAICLPSKHEGGDLIVTHNDCRFKVLPTAPKSAFGYSYLFWYTDLMCELTEVTLGNRLVLTYNLINIGSENVPDAPTSYWQRMDPLESAFLFWKSNYTKQASSCPKFLAYTLDNMYGEHNLSRAILQGDDYQRVNGLLQLCKRHEFIIYLAKLQLQARRETSDPIENILELQHVVQLDGTKVFDVAPLSALDIVQDNIFGDSLNSEGVLSSISNNRANSNQVCHRFAVVIMPAESCIDFYFESAKSSATGMGDWICKLTAACIVSNGNDSAKVDLRRACNLVIEDVTHWRDTRSTSTMPSDSHKSTSAMDSLLGIVIRGGIFLNDQNLCGEALYGDSSEIPVPAVVEALNHFGFSKLLCDLDKTICRFKHMYQDFRAFLRIHNHYRGYKDSTALTNLVAWMKPRAKQTFVRTPLKFKEDGEKAAKVGIICGETYLKEELLPAVILDILRAEKSYSKKPAAVFRFLTVIADGQRGDKRGLETAQHVFSSVLRVFIPRIKFVPFRPEHNGEKHDPIPVKSDDILQLLRQCVSLELRRHMGLLFDNLDTVSIGQSSITLKGLFLPLIKKFDEMPAGQTPGTITQEFHLKGHQLAEKLRKLHPFLFPQPRDMSPELQHISPEPRHMSPQPQHMSSMDLPKPELGCECKECQRLVSFLEDPTVKHVLFHFGTERRFAHHKKHHLPQIANEEFTHTCKTSTQIDGTVSYKVTIRKISAKAKRVRLKKKEERDNPQIENTERKRAKNSKASVPKTSNKG